MAIDSTTLERCCRGMFKQYDIIITPEGRNILLVEGYFDKILKTSCAIYLPWFMVFQICVRVTNECVTLGIPEYLYEAQMRHREDILECAG